MDLILGPGSYERQPIDFSFSHWCFFFSIPLSKKKKTMKKMSSDEDKNKKEVNVCLGKKNQLTKLRFSGYIRVSTSFKLPPNGKGEQSSFKWSQWSPYIKLKKDYPIPTDLWKEMLFKIPALISNPWFLYSFEDCKKFKCLTKEVQSFIINSHRTLKILSIFLDRQLKMSSKIFYSMHIIFHPSNCFEILLCCYHKVIECK